MGRPRPHLRSGSRPRLYPVDRPTALISAMRRARPHFRSFVSALWYLAGGPPRSFAVKLRIKNVSALRRLSRLAMKFMRLAANLLLFKSATFE